MKERTDIGYMLLVDPLLSIRVWFIIIILLYFNNHDHWDIHQRGQPTFLCAVIRDEDWHLTLSSEKFKTVEGYK